MYKIKFHREIENDLVLLPKKIRKEAVDYFEKLQKDYNRYSQPLFNMSGRNLQGCRKTYFANAEYRIVSKLDGDTLKIVNIIAVAKRDKFEVYHIASERLKES